MTLAKGIKLAIVAGSIASLGLVSALEIMDVGEKMPEITGKVVESEDLSSKDGKVKVRYDYVYQSAKMLGDEKKLFTGAYLICNGFAEKRPFSVHVIYGVSKYGVDELYLDLDRDGYIDYGGKLVGEDLASYIESFRDGINPPVVNEAPECR